MSDEAPRVQSPTVAAAPPPVIEYASADQRKLNRRIGFLALGTSVFIPGLGQLIAHQRRRAIGFFAAYVGLSFCILGASSVPILVPALLGLLPLNLIFQFWVAIDAF